MRRLVPILAICTLSAVVVVIIAIADAHVADSVARPEAGTRHAADAGLPSASGRVVADDADAARSALRRGGYPWYDSANDRVKGVDLTPRKEWPWLRWLVARIDRVFRAVVSFFSRIAEWIPLPGIGPLGNAIPIVLTCIGVVLLAVLISVLWRSSSPRQDGATTGRGIGSADRIKLLPGDLASTVADPLAEAEERRRRGDFSGAIVFLFAHQLIELDRLGLIRLAPGSTARRYVRQLADPRIGAWLSESLGLFEQAYYGRKQITANSFEPVWMRAQSFRSYLASIEKGAP